MFWSQLGLNKVGSIRDLWTRSYVSGQPDGYRVVVPAHGAVMLRVSAEERPIEQSLNIVFIGDSITMGVFADYVSPNDAPPAKTVAYLAKQPSVDQVNFTNQGIGGHTTVNFLPSSGERFRTVEQAAERLRSAYRGTLVFSVMLGTNDSAMNGPLGSPVSPAQYRKNITTIIDRLLKDYPGSKVVLHRPIWYSPNTYNGARYLADGLKRLQNYFPEIDAVVESHRRTHPGRVFAGDKRAFEIFEKNHQAYLLPEQGQQGIFYLHPTRAGAEILGQYWGEAIHAALLGDAAMQTEK